MKSMKSRARPAAPLRRDAANRISLALPAHVACTALGARFALLAVRCRPWRRLVRRLSGWMAPRPPIRAPTARAPAR